MIEANFASVRHATLSIMEPHLFVPFNLLLLTLMVVAVPGRLSKVDQISRRLDEFLVGVERPEKSNDSDEPVDLWQRYEFDTGVGNRDELRIKNITTKIDPRLFGDIDNYQFVVANDDFFLAGSSEHYFYFYKFDWSLARTIFRLDVNVIGKIQSFKLLAVPNASLTEPEVVFDVLAIICVESSQGTDMLWYRFDGKELVYLDSWPIRNRVEGLQFFHHEGQNRLLILREEILELEKKFSPIDIYGFDIEGEKLNLWLTRRSNVPKTFDIQVCPSYENTIVALRRRNVVAIYEYEVDENKEDLFIETHNVTSNNLKNTLCFESGHVRYLVTSGPEAALFDFFVSEFQHDSYSEHVFNEFGETAWIQSMLVDNYRQDSILFVQLKNSSVIVLAWKGRGFEKISLPNSELENIDLSSITVIPRYGFVYGNKLVKIETSLVESERPVRHEVEKLLRTKYALADVVEKQKLVLDETESRLNKSYFANPRVTGFWNLSNIEADNLEIGKGVIVDKFVLGTRETSLDDFLSDQSETIGKMKDLESRIDEIGENLAKSLPIDEPEVRVNGDLLVDGNLDVLGTMRVDNLTFERLNGLTRDEILRDFSNYDDEHVIEGEKTFESIEAENLNVLYVNGVPIEDIKFDRETRNYADVDFSKFTRLKIEGNLNFTRVNGIEWEEFFGRVILKSQSSIIPGVTIVRGDLVAENVEIDRFNDQTYPEGYVMSEDREPVLLTGTKKFDNLILGNLDVDTIKMINGVPIDHYVTTTGDRILEDEAIFDNLKITENLRIEGRVTGLPEDHRASRLTLKETSRVTGDVVIDSLTVIGKLAVENPLNGMTWSEMDDLVTIGDAEVEITGSKVFSGRVEVNGELTIDRRIVNGQSIDDFVTLDTDQVLPNLTKISGNVSFGHVTREDVEDMKRVLADRLSNSSACLDKILVFKMAPVVDRLFFKIANDNVTSLEFITATNRTFANVHFANLQVSNLRGREYSPLRVNGANFEDFARSAISRTQPQVTTGSLEIDELRVNFLSARTIDGYSAIGLEELRDGLDNFYDRAVNGSGPIGKLTIEGTLEARTINGKSLEDFYDLDTMGEVTIFGDLYVKKLTIGGLVNGMNFTSFVEDSVMKNDRDIVVEGRKTFGKVICESLHASRINGKSVDDIFDPDKHQLLTGLIRVRGTAKVLDRFETSGKIGKISWPELSMRSRYLGNDTYSLNGNVTFVNESVAVENLLVTDFIQGFNSADFSRSFVRKKNANLTIDGPIVFKDPVTIDSTFTITDSFNDLNVKHFYEHAVLIDRPLDVKSKIRFAKSVLIEKDLLVDKELEAEKIGGVDLKELYESALFVDRPTSIPGSVSVGNVVFDSDIEVENLNGIDLRSVITLEGEQTFDGALDCRNITVGKLDVLGTVNGLSLNSLYENTLMLSGDQNISRHVIFQGKVRVRKNFDATLVNGIDPRKIISLDGNETLIGKFIFDQPIILHGNLNTRGPINGVDLLKWEATVVTKQFPIRQIVKGAWTVRGNVHFEKNVYGGDHFDGVNVTKFADDLYRRDMEMELKIDDIKKDLRSFCEDLRILKTLAENQIYRYEYFDYLQVMNFENRITSVHHYELGSFDYLMINFESCHLDIFVFTGEEFTKVASLPNVGKIERWYTLSYEGETYFLTVGKHGCDRSSGNLWKIKDDIFVHVEDLGNVTDAKKIKEDEFLTIFEGKIVRRSIGEIRQRSLSQPESHTIGNENYKFVAGSSELLVANRDTIVELEIANLTENRRIGNVLGTGDIYRFLLGIYEREVFVYYDRSVSEDYLFISENLRQPKILQTIKAQNPSSIVVLNFDGLVENLLIFLEDQRSLQIYEYRGIEGFVYRETIRIRAEKIFGFRLRRYSRLAKKHCVAAIQGTRLVLMEAKMQGEKLDMGNLNCN